MELKCYVYPGWRPRIRAASPRRDWMDATPESFAYRCLPLNIANAHGWQILSPCGFTAEWNGGRTVDDVVIRPDPGTRTEDAPVSLFGQGTFTFHVAGLFRTPPGVNLWVGGSPNAAKDGVAPLSGIIETDWAPFTFTMNWRFTRAHHAVRFDENEPFCFFFPVDRNAIEQVKPRIVPIEEAPELKQQFEQWSASRDAFQAQIAAHPPEEPNAKWQKFYYRGVDAAGQPGAADHRTKLRLADFAGGEAFHRPARSAPGCPVTRPAPVEPPPGKLEWLMLSLARLRALSPDERIQRVAGLSAEAFLVQHYAANWPVILTGELADWPALRLWTPDYLKRRVGGRIVEVQGDRTFDPDYERNMKAHARQMPFDAFIGLIERAESGNDLYLTAYNSARNVEALSVLDEDLGHLDKLLAGNGDGARGMMWIGPAGTFTPLHHDLTNNLLLQITGRKRVMMAGPLETPRLYNDHHVYSRIRDLAEPGIAQRFPRLDGMRVHQLVLEPGDALFIPLGWWHQVTALDFSVSITHTNFRWPNDAWASWPAH
jgi:hypothetical protein